MKISLVIPVYNVEKFVAKCLSSCIYQDIDPDDFEIIIINDGSTDGSLEICTKFALSERNITLLSHDNAGLSLTRNRGILMAKGEYIWFIDSDDWIEENCLREIVKLLNGIDVLALSYIEAFDNLLENSIHFPEKKTVKNGVDLLSSSFIVPSQFYIYRRHFLLENNLFFEPNIIHEDLEFTPKMLFLAKKAKVYIKPVYFFYKRSGSLTTTVNPKKSFDLLHIALKLIAFEKDFVSQQYKYLFHNIIWLAINNALFNSLIMDKLTQNVFKNELYRNKQIFQHLNRTEILKYKVERVLFILFPMQIIRIYQLLRFFKAK